MYKEVLESMDKEKLVQYAILLENLANAALGTKYTLESLTKQYEGIITGYSHLRDAEEELTNKENEIDRFNQQVWEEFRRGKTEGSDGKS